MMPFMPSQPDEGPCSDCGFSWSIDIGDAIRLVQSAPEDFRDVFAKGVDKDDRAGGWSSTGYLWHVVDVLRFGTERLWTLALDPTSGVPGWDQERLAEARSYERLSLIVGLRALEVATADWVRAAEDAPLTATVTHPTLGELAASHSIRRNAHEVQHHARDIKRLRDRSDTRVCVRKPGSTKMLG